jgi:lysophospholipase L1-like esterase
MTYIRLVFAIVALALLGTAASAGDPPVARTADSAITPVDRNPKRHEAFLKRIKEGPVGLLFLGDSIMDAFPGRGKDTWAKFAPYNPADFGISAERTEDVLWRITNGELDGIDPKAVVIMIGTNNIGHFADEKVEWAAAGIKKIVDTVREKLPKTKVLLLGVFPRSVTKDDVLRKKVAAINDIIKDYAQPPGVTYLDIGPKFLDEQGTLSKDIMPDALHPNAKGYGIWYDAMWPVLEKLLK